MQPSDAGLVMIGAMLVVPQFTLIHPYLHLLIIAPILVFTGCHRAKLELAKGDASQVCAAAAMCLHCRRLAVPTARANTC